MVHFAETPLSLQSLSRLAIRRALGPNRLDQIDRLPLTDKLLDFVNFRDMANSVDQIPIDIVPDIKELNKVLRNVTSRPPSRVVKYRPRTAFNLPTIVDTVGVKGSESVPPSTNGGPPPPPPPPLPPPPKPMFWRFPEAEFSDKGVPR